jgi:hypothetical protein
MRGEPILAAGWGLLRRVDSRHSEYCSTTEWESGKDYFEIIAGLRESGRGAEI